MAAAQQRTKQSHRMSTGGRDILSRMLLMERQSKNKRASSTSPISHPNGQSEYFDGPTAHASPTSRQDMQASSSSNPLPTHPALIPRAETWPVLTPAQGSAETGPAKTSLKIETTKAKDDPTPNEICLSPSWPDHGEKKRRKEKRQRDKEQKELDKKIKQYGGLKRELSKKARKEEEKEKQRAADVIAGKRLSKKPPPAAMETQKMPSGLRRSSFASIFSSRPSSREGSRRNSQSGDEKRLSGISLSSFTTERSQSTPATSDEPANSFDKFRSTVSPTPPQLPGFSWKPRGGSNETSRGVSWVSEDAYDKEVVEFAYRLDASAFIAESEKIEKKRNQNERPPRKSHFKEHTEGNGFSRSATEPILMSSKQGSTVLKAPPRSPKRLETNQQDSSAQAGAKKEEVEITIRAGSSKFNHSVARNGHAGGELPIRAANERQVKSPEALAPQVRPAIQLRPSHDGSSYVQKQRMYQQQMSIASFEDQQTVQDAYELATENEKAVGAQSHGASTLSDSHSSAPIRKAATPLAHGYDRQDSEETIVTLAPDGQSRRDGSPQSRLSASGRPQKSTPLSQSTKAVGVPDRPNPDAGGVNSMQLQDPGPTNNTLAPASSKADKILGFRKRSKPPPSKIWVSEDEKASTSYQHPMSAPPTQLVERASKRSRVEKMLIDPLSAQMSFKKRAGSAGSTTLTPPSKELFRTHSRNRTNSSEALTADLPSPVPWSGPINTPKPRQSKAREQPLPTRKEPKTSEEKWPEVVGNSGKSRSQSNEGIRETTSDSIRGHPIITNMESKDVNKQHSPATAEQKTTDVKGLTRYELVETIKPRAISSKATSSVEVGPPVVSSPFIQASTARRPNIIAPPKPVQAELEVVLESVNSEGVIRKTSMTRPRSNPQLQTQTTVANSIPSLDFLPQLKHQPLVKRNSPPRTSIDSAMPQVPIPPGSLGSLSSSPANSKLLTSTAVDLPVVLPRSPRRQSGPFATPNSPLQHPAPATPPAINRSSTSIPSASTTSLSKVTETAGVAAAKPVAKLFVICCKCKFWHDLPSKLYEAMALPREAQHANEERESEKQDAKEKGKDGTAGETTKTTHFDTTMVKCPWCEHAMTTWCCQGWTTVVYLHQRHH